jgi:Na+/phosphate symporter
MVIHKTHTKKDLVEVVDVFEFHDAIENVSDLNKECLSSLLSLHLRTIDKIKPDLTYFDCQDLEDLREYLKNPSPKQVLSIKEKDLIIDKAKKLIFYSKICQYSLSATTYDTIEEVIKDASLVRKYGDIPTCRRAIKLLNGDNKILNKIDIVMTYRMQQRLEKSKRLKAGALASMTKSSPPPGGMFIVSFD